MSRVLACAWREYKATAGTKAFLLGTFGVPVLITGIMVIAVGSNLFTRQARALEGEIVVVDTTEGRFVADGLDAFFSEEGQRARMEKKEAEVREEISEQVPAGMASEEQLEQGAAFIAQQALMDVSVRRVDDGDGVIGAEKEKLKDADGPLAVIAVEERALFARDYEREDEIIDARESGVMTRDEAEVLLDAMPGLYSIYHRPSVDHERLGDINAEVKRLIIDERIARAGHETEEIRGLMADPLPKSRAVSEEGESGVRWGCGGAGADADRVSHAALDQCVY